ncbi:Dual O-methyltransferase FAD-dependent monooxygenase CTB3 [Hyphodiscus hymeniophilus]|uniref:Dual O-methyltransferase FAD-dependent monooxygenase CTB3 n=1 Tax=Hyphodiscus hymeniophilus TaxID=353542 RepID=A0A9P6VH91_9HELO|nr:Dual O-methyltransferase FAD-dependent monooxygenase CTB3 [Hyphodiscus hymeniophilus]
MSSPHILVIGGGIGGLALSQNLRKRGVSFTLFERDASPSARAQGYRIRVAGEGADGLLECLDDELLKVFEETCAEMKSMSGARLNAVDGSPMVPLGPPGMRPGGPAPGPPWMKRDGRAYTVDRTMLRNVLLLGQEQHVKFGKTLTKYETTDSGITAYFSDGSSEQGTLLVGADGTTSPVRKQLLPNFRYLDTGSRVIYGKTPITEELLAHFPANAMAGTTIIQDQSPLTLFMEPILFPNDASLLTGGRVSRIDDYVYWVLGGSFETFGLSDTEFHSLSGKESAMLSLKLTAHWHPSFKPMFELQNTSQSAPLRLISSKPEPCWPVKRAQWTPDARVVFIGDAIHAMMPAGGSGANTALRDAALLARIIAEEGVSEETMGGFADQMWDYALPAIKGSAIAATKLLGFKGFESAREVVI